MGSDLSKTTKDEFSGFNDYTDDDDPEFQNTKKSFKVVKDVSPSSGGISQSIDEFSNPSPDTEDDFYDKEGTVEDISNSDPFL